MKASMKNVTSFLALSCWFSFPPAALSCRFHSEALGAARHKQFLASHELVKDLTQPGWRKNIKLEAEKAKNSALVAEDMQNNSELFQRQKEEHEGNSMTQRFLQDQVRFAEKEADRVMLRTRVNMDTLRSRFEPSAVRGQHLMVNDDMARVGSRTFRRDTEKVTNNLLDEEEDEAAKEAKAAESAVAPVQVEDSCWKRWFCCRKRKAN